jgi:hypothetical protein
MYRVPEKPMRTKIQATLTEAELAEAVRDWLGRKDNARVPEEETVVELTVRGFAGETALAYDIHRIVLTISWIEDV